MRVTETIGPAWEHMRRILFRPFNLGTWFAFGFVFFLQSCVEGGGSLHVPPGGGGGSGHHGRSSDSDSNVAGLLHHVMGARAPEVPPEFAPYLVAIAVGVIALVIPLALLAMWIGARGQMMAIQSVARGEANVNAAWNETSRAGSAMFRFHLVLAGLGLITLGPTAAVGVAVAMPVIRNEAEIASILPMLIALGGLALGFLVPLALVGAMARNFVAPVMLKHGVGAREGWKRFWAASRGYVGNIVVFFVLRFFFAVAAGIAGTLASLLTCCVGFLPVVHQTLMAPWYVFERAWSLEVLASLGPDFDLRSVPPAPPGYPPAGFGYGAGPYGPGGYGPGGYGPGGYGPGYGPGGYGPAGGPPPGGGFGGPYGS